MRIAGNYTFAATREAVWSTLNDPEALARAIPGCQRLEMVGENEQKSILEITVQAARGAYTGRVRIDNVVSLESYDIHVEGTGSNGFFTGAGAVKLRTDGAQTILDYGGEAMIGGPIADVGQQLLDSAARSLISQSLRGLAAEIEARQRRQQARLSEAPAVEEAPQPSPWTPESIQMSSATAAQRATGTVEGQDLSEAAAAHPAVEDFFARRPWLPWILVAFLLGYLLGRRRA
ncbi:MAG: carbon monoxide dehydrogenase subunit G [Oscillochloridaceae bacterium]|nr:carbon monoxide dehydrogenase subunit G [Chloroflexaceae bacterium]MDW8391373.1 carbon monoxide dehydrogenase subunit G [Oscillochloridaceae bacterium]